MRNLPRVLWPLGAGGALLFALSPALPHDVPGAGLWILLSGLVAAGAHLAAVIRPGVSKEAPLIAASVATSEAQRWREAYESLFQEKRDLLDRVDELATQREVALTITSVLEFRPMVETILEVTMSSLEVEAVILHLSSGERLDPVAGRLREESVSRPMSEEGISLAASRIRSLSWERIAAHAALFRRDGDRTRLYVPLAGRGEALGVLEFVRGPQDPPFTERDREKAASLGGTIAIALTNARLYELAVTDGLTGLYVHRHFQHRLAEELRRAERTKRPVSLLMIDIDHFKKFNDDHGHQTGDRVLAGVAEILRQSARSIDVVARYGGEEMALVLPETDAPGAALLAERIRACVAAAAFDSEAGEKISVNVSIGAAASAPGELRKDLIRRTDEALYAAKRNGRNRVETAPPPSAVAAAS